MASQEIKVNGTAFSNDQLGGSFNGPAPLGTPLYKDVDASSDAPVSSTSLYNSADKKLDENLDSAALRVESRTLRYPLDGSNDHFIRFYINIPEESKLISTGRVAAPTASDRTGQNRANINQTSMEAIKSAAAVGGGVLAAGPLMAASRVLFSAKGGAAALVGTALVGGSSWGEGIVDAVSDGATAAKDAAGNFVELVADKTLRLTQKLMRLAANITLYAPGQVQARYNFDYELDDDLLVTLAQQQNFDSLKSGLDELFSAKAGVAIGKFGRILTSSTQTGSMLSKTAVNRRADVMFRHVGNREFAFSYTFAPKSAEEAVAVDNIIFMFKYFAHPEMLEGYGNFLYLYPAEFDIEYGLMDGRTEVKNPYINKISSCVLTSVDVQYSPTGKFQTLEKGEPVITVLNLSFKEIETLHRDRIGEGY